MKIGVKKTSILYIISSLTNQGPVQQLYNIVAYMDFEKFDVSVVSLSNVTKNSLKDQFEKLPIRIVQYDSIGKYNFYKYFKNIKMIIEKNHIDIFHSQCFRSLIIASFFRKQVVCFHSIYIYPGLQSKAMNGKISGTAINICTKYIIKKVQCPVACAKSLSEELLIKDRIKVEYIRNGVIPFKNLVGEKMDFKKRLKLDTNYRYFVSVGRLSPEKNISTLIEAFKEANPVGFKLIIIGDGQLMESLRKIANENIIFTGFISNIGDYLAASDFYITTSLTEGMALSTIYGMASGLPLLLSDIPPHEEIFDLAEGNPIGSLFNNNTIVDAIRKMALCPTYNKLSANIIDIYKNNFTADKMSTSYQRFYESALKA